VASVPARAGGPAETEDAARSKSGVDVSVGATADADAGTEPAADAAAESSDASGTGEGSTEYAPEGTTKPQWAKIVEGRKRWGKRWLPVRNQLEIGVFGGVFIASPRHDFYNPEPADRPQIPLWSVAPDVGLRFAYFPLTFLGVEVEGALIPNRVRTPNDDAALLWAARGHAILKAPWWRVAPFALVGIGAMGISSPPEVQGNDVDPVFHYGVGLNWQLNRLLALRLEGRHLLAAQERLQDNRTNHAEALLGLSVTLGRKLGEVPPPPPPPPPPDRDGDGVLDYDDACVDEPGAKENDGCPWPDTDGDGLVDPEDECPKVPGVAEYAGCPVPDTDGDGILDPDDDCDDEPETWNKFEDGDGCPDEIPEEIVKFTGTIEGIRFETGKSKIRRSSRPTLDEAVGVLKKWPALRLEVVGHTDNVGKREDNIELSKARAQAVVDYFIAAGLGPERFESRGAGPDEPVDPTVDNDTKANRAKNRRTEFKILGGTEKSVKVIPGEEPESGPEPEAEPAGQSAADSAAQP
jgi:OOP family OmpA-OmpF porin